MIKDKNKFYQFVSKVVRWIIMSEDNKSIPISPFDALCGRLGHVKGSMSLNDFIAFNKAIRSNFMNYLSGNPIRDPRCKTTKDGIPVIFQDLIPQVRGGSSVVIRMILTILFSTRTFRTKADPDTTSITQAFTGDVTNISMYMGSF